MNRLLIMLLAVLFVPSCSDQPGWTLWGHMYSEIDEKTNIDKWESYESYSKLADCKAQIPTLVARKIKFYEGLKKEEGFEFSKPLSEKDTVKVTATLAPTEKETTFTDRFFCVPFSVDPPPKDQSMWTLWEEVSASTFHSWIPDESYLTGFGCERQREFRVQRENERLKKETSKSSIRNLFHCFPASETPWGKEG